jgi:hypothetical protein
MKLRLLAFAVASIILAFGCGGSGTGTVPDGAGDPSIAVEDPDGGVDGASDPAGEDPADPSDPAVAELPQQVLIKGALIGAEGVGLPGVDLTFHSDPVSAVTGPGGLFEAVLEVGEHTFEAASEVYGDYSGSLTVSAAGLVDQFGQALGSFTASGISALQSNACEAANLVDLGDTQAIGTGLGVAQSAFGSEIEVQGKNQTSLIIGNSEMLANISLDGRISGLWFPTVGAFNHVPYLSEVQVWVKDFQGSFGGIRRGDDYFWLTDRTYWNHPTVNYLSTTKAPIAEITYQGIGVCSGAQVKEKVYVAYDSIISAGQRVNVLVRDFTVTISNINNLCKTTENSSHAPELAVYARFNPNDTYQLFKQWIPAADSRSCEGERLRWVQEDTDPPIVSSPLVKSDPAIHSYAIAMAGFDRYGNPIGMGECIESIETEEAAQALLPHTSCVPTGVKGALASWPIPSTTKRVMVHTAGSGGGSAPCGYALDYIEDKSASYLENGVTSEWTIWVGNPAVNWSMRDDTKRWLITMKMLADRNTGAIIAAPSQEPTFYYSWPRDGIFQSLAFMMAGKYDVVDDFFEFLFGMLPGVEPDHGWNQAYSSLDSVRLGLPDWPDRINIEEDQAPTVLWGLWVYWKKRGGQLPPGITLSSIKNVADYVIAQVCPVSGLIRPSIDRLESPLLHIGQSLYTNSAAYAGLLGVAEILEDEDDTSADGYRQAALDIRDAVLDMLCDSNECHTRIGYLSSTDLQQAIADLLLLGNLGSACLKSISMPYVDIPLEMMMSFAWPFHIFDMDDVRVRNYYDDVWTTHQELSDFDADNPLWVPRYLYSYLYAKSAYASSDVDAGYKAELLPDIQEVEANLDAIKTEYGYLMDQYIGGDEGEFYGSDYAGMKLGSASRPLGWAQAMGVLMAYAQSGKHIPLLDAPCADQCSGSETKCEGGTLYGCIAGAEGCMEWDGGTACVSGVCDASGVACTCAPNDHLGCYDEDVYWFDSCDAVGDFSQDCGEDELTGSPFCQSGHVYRQLIDRTCLGAACTELTTSQKVIDCGTAGCSGSVCCTSNTSSKCYGGDLYYYSSCNVRQGLDDDCDGAGCTSNECCTPNTTSKCYNGDLYYYSSCNVRQNKDEDCGTAGCESNECCDSEDTWKCYNDDVYWYSSCDVRQDKKDECGEDVEGTPYCSGNIVKRNDIIRGCSGSSCTQTTVVVTVENCGTKKECHSGVCECPTSTPWNNNTLSITDVWNGKFLSWSPPSPNWVQTFYIARAPGSMTPPPGMSIGNTGGTSFTDTTGVPPQCYNYVVYAYNACGQNKNISTILNECW